MRFLLTLVLVISICAAGISAEDVPFVGKLYVGQNYLYGFSTPPRSPGSGWGWTECTTEKQFTGSFWAILTDHGCVLVTAKHILGLNTTMPDKIDGKDVDQDKVKLEKMTARVLLGTLAYEPSYIGVVNGIGDIAFLLPKDGRVLQGLMPIELSIAPPRTGEWVKIDGFPRTADQEMQLAMVTATHEGDGFFILDRSVAGGYSGGVVLDAAGKAYGVITSTDAAQQQTTVIRITPAMYHQIQWQEANKALVRYY